MLFNGLKGKLTVSCYLGAVDAFRSSDIKYITPRSTQNINACNQANRYLCFNQYVNSSQESDALPVDVF